MKFDLEQIAEELAKDKQFWIDLEEIARERKKAVKYGNRNARGLI